MLVDTKTGIIERQCHRYHRRARRSIQSSPPLWSPSIHSTGTGWRYSDSLSPSLPPPLEECRSSDLLYTYVRTVSRFHSPTSPVLTHPIRFSIPLPLSKPILPEPISIRPTSTSKPLHHTSSATRRTAPCETALLTVLSLSPPPPLLAPTKRDHWWGRRVLSRTSCRAVSLVYSSVLVSRDVGQVIARAEIWCVWGGRCVYYNALSESESRGPYLLVPWRWGWGNSKTG